MRRCRALVRAASLERRRTAFITLEARGNGTRYTAAAIHGTPASREEHERLGFHTGWSTALDQLVEHAKTM